LNFPTNIKRIRIDVGTGSTAPNAALWLKNNKNTAVLCFEADPRSYNILVNGGDTNQYPNELRLTKKHLLVFKNKLIKKIEPSLVKIYNVAISNSNNDKVNFYLTDQDNFGNSSLLKPIEKKLKQNIIEKIEISTFKLKYFLDKVNFKKIDYVEFLKTDTQGNDLNVIKSCENYLSKICFIQTEYWALEAYKGEKSRKESLNLMNDFMQKNGFKLYYFTITDAFYVNSNLIPIILKQNFIDNCIDFKNGLFRKSYFFNIFPGKLLIFANIIIFLRGYKLFNFIFYKLLKVKFKKFI
jgi:FkbM family methyltransferase